jgi:iron-sulfur cluster repair protein YtfE (RIC family)
MTEVLVAKSESDLRAAEAVERHHAEMAGRLGALVAKLVVSARDEDADAAEDARQRVMEWCDSELLPHALAEEQTLYPAARATVEGRLLLQAMIGEHETIGRLVRTLDRSAGQPVAAAATAAALRAVFESHLAKENDLVIPLLLRTPGVSVAELLGGMHELLGAEPASEQTSGACGSDHSCTCGETDGDNYPELDARSIPHAIRHATILGALETVQAGPGDPRPPRPAAAAGADPRSLGRRLRRRLPRARA